MGSAQHRTESPAVICFGWGPCAEASQLLGTWEALVLLQPKAAGSSLVQIHHFQPSRFSSIGGFGRRGSRSNKGNKDLALRECTMLVGQRGSALLMGGLWDGSRMSSVGTASTLPP